MKTKIEKKYTYLGFGFPVELHDVHMVDIGGQWAPKIDVEKLSKKVISDFSKRTTTFTGDEVYFIRSFFKLSKVEFGKKLGDLSHAAISNWEKKRENEITFQKDNFDSLIKLLRSTQQKPKRVLKIRKKAPTAKSIVDLLKGAPNPTSILARARELLLKQKQVVRPHKATVKKATRKVAHLRNSHR